MSAPAKILIIESHTPLAMMFVHVLTQAGCDTSVARNGELGLKLAKENKFDLIALNMDLPDFSGLEVCRALKQQHYSRHTPVVFVSKRHHEQDLQQSLETAAVIDLTKPFDAHDFTSQLLSYISPSDIGGNAK